MWWTAIMPFVFSVMRGSTVEAVKFCEFSSTSATIGTPPSTATLLAEAMNVRHVVITSSPRLRPSPTSASSSAVVPFETAYRLQMQPDSSFVLFWMNVFLVALLAALVPIKRLAVRRLHDANFSGWWLWLLAIPYLGWLAVLVLLLLPSASFPNRFDRFAEPAERQKPR